MVRTLDNALLAAVNSLTRRPAITLTIEDHIIHYEPFQTPGTADAWNDLCIANDNSIVRVYVGRGGTGFDRTVYYQRITDPTIAGQWSLWTVFPGSAGNMFQDGGVAIANSGGILRAFAQRGTGGNNLWVWSSSDNGQTWTGPVTVLMPPANALLKGISSAGNNDVFFLYDVIGGEAIGCSFFSGSSWSALTTWSLATLPFAAGLAVTQTGSSYVLIYSDGYTLASCSYNPTGNIWSSGPVIAPATSTAIVRLAPCITFADGIYTLTSIEADSGLMTGTVYSYPRLRQSIDLVHWSNGMIMHDLTCSYGAIAFKLTTPASGNAGSRYYLASLATVFSSPTFQTTNAKQYLDISGAVLSYQRSEQHDTPARIEITLDNAQGIYNTLVSNGNTYQPIGLNASLVLKEGYKVGTPPAIADTVNTGTFHIEEIHFLRSPEKNQLLLVGRDLSRNLDLVSRYQNTYTNQTVGFLIKEICARAGLLFIVLPATSQINQLIGNFVLHAGQTYRHALNELCATYGLSYFLDQAEVLQFREFAVSDLPVWSYQPEIEQVSFGSNDQRANHIVVSGKPPVNGVLGALTTSEVYDDQNIHLLGLERVLHYVDPKLTSSAQCNQKATFLMLQETRKQTRYRVSLPLNPALQMFDSITLTDSLAPGGSGRNATCRIVHLIARYNAQQAVYELQLELEGM